MENHSPSGMETEAFRQTRTVDESTRNYKLAIEFLAHETRFYSVINSSPVSNISFYTSIRSIDRISIREIRKFSVAVSCFENIARRQSN